MKYLLQISFIFLLLASLSINVYSQNNELDKIQNAYQKFLDNKKGNAEQKKLAYETAKEFIQLVQGEHLSDVVLYVQLWIDKYELSQKINFDVTDWQRFKRCGITFLAPSTLKDLNAQAIDSCVASFENEKMLVAIDYGRYSEKFTKYEDIISDFGEEIIQIDSKQAQFANYEYSKKFLIGGLYKFVNKYVAGVHIEVTKFDSLNMKVSGNTKKDIEIARQIFSTIKFDK